MRRGLGCAQLGNLYVAVDDLVAGATVDAAWDLGVRYFDTAPHYGLGLSERRLGAALAGRPRDEFTVSTKVGRRLVADPDGAGRPDPEGFVVAADHRRVWDFTADGVHRSLADSLARLQLDRIDLVLLHDPEEHARAALEEAYPALDELRRQGVIGGVGVGSKQTAILERFVRETDVDAIMVAGRYTLLEQPALDGLLPAAAERDVAVINAGVFNSGLLASARPTSGSRYEYTTAPPAPARRAAAIAAVCTRHGTTLPAAALAFAGAHPAVASVVVGAHSATQVRQNFAAAQPPPGLWADLVSAGLLRADAPTPS